MEGSDGVNLEWCLSGDDTKGYVTCGLGHTSCET